MAFRVVACLGPFILFTIRSVVLVVIIGGGEFTDFLFVVAFSRNLTFSAHALDVVSRGGRFARFFEINQM